MDLPTFPCGWLVSSSNANSLQVRGGGKGFFFVVTNKQSSCFQGVALCPDPCQLLFFHRTVPRLCSRSDFSKLKGGRLQGLPSLGSVVGPRAASVAHVAAHLHIQKCEWVRKKHERQTTLCSSGLGSFTRTVPLAGISARDHRQQPGAPAAL